MKYEFIATGKRIRFMDVAIGNPFAAHGRMWVRVSYESASALAYSGYIAAACCNFATEPEDEWVEFVNILVDGKEVEGVSLPKHLIDESLESL